MTPITSGEILLWFLSVRVKRILPYRNQLLLHINILRNLVYVNPKLLGPLFFSFLNDAKYNHVDIEFNWGFKLKKINY